MFGKVVWARGHSRSDGPLRPPLGGARGPPHKPLGFTGAFGSGTPLAGEPSGAVFAGSHDLARREQTLREGSIGDATMRRTVEDTHVTSQS